MSELIGVLKKAVRSAAFEKVQGIANKIPVCFKEEQAVENTSRQENMPLQNFEGIKIKIVTVDDEHYNVEIDLSALDDYNRKMVENVYMNNVMKKVRG